MDEGYYECNNGSTSTDRFQDVAPVASGEGLQAAQCPVQGPEQDQRADGQAGADCDRESF